MVGGITSLFGGLLGLGAQKLLGGAPKPAQPQLNPTRDDAAALTRTNDDLLRRKGGAADILTGSRGAEPASTGGKTRLGQ